MNKEPQFDNHDFRSTEYDIRRLIPKLIGHLGKTCHSGPNLQSGRNAAKACEFMIALINERRIDGRKEVFAARDPNGRLVDAAVQASRMGWIELVGRDRYGQDAYLLTESGFDFIDQIENSVIAANQAFQRVLGTLIADAASGHDHRELADAHITSLAVVSSFHTCWPTGVEKIPAKQVRNPTARMLSYQFLADKPRKYS